MAIRRQPVMNITDDGIQAQSLKKSDLCHLSQHENLWHSVK